MTSDKTEFNRVSGAGDIASLLHALAEPGAASLVLGDGGERVPSVAIAAVEAGRALSLEIHARAEIERTLRRGSAFHLLGRMRSGVLRTPPLRALRSGYRDGRLQCRCDFPEWVELRQQRDTFRAALKPGMNVGVTLRSPGGTVRGELNDLSLEGCRVELLAGGLLESIGRAELCELEFHFPDGSRFAVQGRPRHREPDRVHRRVRVGFAFARLGRSDARQLGFYVREIEREAARTVGSARAVLQPSELFFSTRRRR